MFKILKQSLDITPSQVVRLPQWRTNLTLQLLDCVPTLWYLINEADSRNIMSVDIRCFSTGELEGLGFDAPGIFLGTIQLHGAVWHFFLYKEEVIFNEVANTTDVVVPTVDYALTSSPVNLAANWFTDSTTGRISEPAQMIATSPRDGLIDIPVEPSVPVARERRPRVARARDTRTS